MLRNQLVGQHGYSPDMMEREMVQNCPPEAHPALEERRDAQRKSAIRPDSMLRHDANHLRLSASAAVK